MQTRARRIRQVQVAPAAPAVAAQAEAESMEPSKIAQLEDELSRLRAEIAMILDSGAKPATPVADIEQTPVDVEMSEGEQGQEQRCAMPDSLSMQFTRAVPAPQSFVPFVDQNGYVPISSDAPPPPMLPPPLMSAPSQPARPKARKPTQRVEREVSLADVLRTSSGKQSLKPVARSPGGTPQRRAAATPQQQPMGPQDLIALALKNKFKNLQSQTPTPEKENHDNMLEEWEDGYATREMKPRSLAQQF